MLGGRGEEQTDRDRECWGGGEKNRQTETGSVGGEGRRTDRQRQGVLGGRGEEQTDRDREGWGGGERGEEDACSLPHT